LDAYGLYYDYLEATCPRVRAGNSNPRIKIFKHQIAIIEASVDAYVSSESNNASLEWRWIVCRHKKIIGVIEIPRWVVVVDSFFKICLRNKNRLGRRNRFSLQIILVHYIDFFNVISELDVMIYECCAI